MNLALGMTTPSERQDQQYAYNYPGYDLKSMVSPVGRHFGAVKDEEGAMSA